MGDNFRDEEVFIIIPSHNRKNSLLRCLKNLQQNGDIKYNIIVIDDGSTDGTKQAIRKIYPKLNIVDGNGDLWWTGCIETGMRLAYQNEGTYFIWLNDDAFPEEKAIDRLLKITFLTKGIVASTCISDFDGKILNFGRRKKRFGLEHLKMELHSGIHSVDVVSGNLVCVHGRVIDCIGYPDSKSLPMGPGDIDYSLRASKAGIAVLQDSESKEVCEENYLGAERSILYSDEPIMTYLKKIFHLNSSMHWKTKFIFFIRHWKLIGLFMYLRDYSKLLGLILIRLAVPEKLRKLIYVRFAKNNNNGIRTESLIKYYRVIRIK